MDNKALAKGIAKISLIVFALFLFGFFVFNFILPAFANTHNSTVELQPEWSPANQTVNYTVTFCKVSGDTINEVRIYKNYDGSIYYTDFQCYDKPGWEKLYIGSYPACFYVANASSPYYDPLDEDGECEDFMFSARTPPSGLEYCNLTWQFETRDVKYEWKYLYDNTSVDDVAPEITKTVIGPQSGTCPQEAGEECWITNSTKINVSVEEKGVCGISGLDWCEITYTVDGSGPILEKYEDLNGETYWEYYWEYIFSFDEDSVHVLNVTCADIAGNKVEDIETFKVDSTPPETNKTYGNPYHSDGCSEWITSSTPITLTAKDGGPVCHIDGVKTYYRYTLVDDEYCWKCKQDPECAEGISTIYCIGFDNCEIFPTIKDFFVTGRYGDNNPTAGKWELAIWNVSGGSENTVAEDNYGWVNGGAPIPFSLSYDPTTGLVTYTVDGKTLNWTYNTGKAFDYLVIMAKGKHVGEDKCDMFLTNLKVNGIGIGDVNSSGKYVGRQIDLPDGEQQDGFTVTGYASMVWADGCKRDEIPAFHVFAMKTHDLKNCKWNLYENPFNIPEESCHVIEYYSIDALGNKEENKYQCVFVDNTPPILAKEVGNPKIPCKPDDPTGCDYWVTQSTPIDLYCSDQGAHPVNAVKLWYRILLDGTVIKDWTDDGAPTSVHKQITFDEDSVHTLEYYCEDALGNSNGTEKNPYKQVYRVDSTPPIITKTIGDPKVWNEEEEIWYIRDHVTPITYTAEDNSTSGCAVNDVECEWWYWFNGKWYGSGFTNQPIIFKEDSLHKLAIKCWDALGNVAWDNETFQVDSISPVTTKTYGQPYKGVKTPGGLVEWINSSTPITLNATDEKVGVDKIYYRITGPIDDKYCWNQSLCVEAQGGTYKFKEYVVYEPINISQESCHLIEYYSVDKLGNEETVKKQCVFVDNTPPETNKTVGEPKIPCPTILSINDKEVPQPPQPQCWWVRDHVTLITLDCDDTWDGSVPHPVDQETVCYRISFDEESWLTEQYCEEFGGKMEGDWCCAYVGDKAYVFNFTEDSQHDLEFYCRDHLGNAGGTDVEYFKVDSTPPVTTKEIIGPKYEVGNDTYIDGVTKISLTCVDEKEPCAVGVDNIQYRYRVDKGEWTDWKVYTESFSFPEESYHELEYYCNDTLGNEEKHHFQYYYVDKTPPTTTKTYIGPYYEDDTGEWVSSNTLINLTVEDSGPHKTGIKETKYRVTLVDDVYCNKMLGTYCAKEGSGEWQTYTGSFKISNESCHKIEYYSVDNVNKTEEVKWQCVYVDNKAPEPNKTVGKPRTEWDGKDANFYDIADKCWSSDPAKYIECWKVTLFTPITLDCVDPEPHPVDHEETCFKVEVDADDKTEYYCNNLVKGVYNKYGDGFCCGKKAPYEFRFNEETEHNLKYYCVDALGNKGSKIDEEKFKVEGTTFEIQINKKWNLISVPFVMLDDSIDEVFKDIEDKIESVWTYDAVTDEWYLYVPGVGGTLTEMVPGWGYWVKAKNATMLVIGGSLFSPAKTPPQKKVVHGWNLIGYFGTDGQTGYYGPEGNGKSAYCALYSLIDTVIGHPRWSSLVTYWEPDNPKQWKYLELYSNMDPGAGYWLEMDVNDTYTYSTVCGYWW